MQDLTHVVAAAEKELPAELKDRRSFEVHDFTTSQALDSPLDAFLPR
jgi:hypothetical protein